MSDISYPSVKPLIQELLDRIDSEKENNDCFIDYDRHNYSPINPHALFRTICIILKIMEKMDETIGLIYDTSPRKYKEDEYQAFVNGEQTKGTANGLPRLGIAPQEPY